jgi:hypothetical protein
MGAKEGRVKQDRELVSKDANGGSEEKLTLKHKN